MIGPHGRLARAKTVALSKSAHGLHAVSTRAAERAAGDNRPAPRRHLVLLAAAEPVGDPLLLWDAARRLDIGPGAADDLEAQELLAIGERVAFRHPLVRSAVYQSATPQERRTAHLVFANQLFVSVKPWSGI
jgi:hypothetical protein